MLKDDPTMYRTRNFLRKVYPYFLGSKAVESSSSYLPVKDKFTNEIVSSVALADEKALEAAIAGATAAAQGMKQLPAYKRKEVLNQIANELTERQEEFAATLTVEVGKPIRDARVEVHRAITTFQFAAEEAIRVYGSSGSMEISARNAGFNFITQRFPVGPVSMITPFNFPLNLAAHKVAPAIAAGCTFVLKPSDRTPITTSLLGEVLAKTGLPEGAFAIVPSTAAVADVLVTDPRMKMLSFTGSARVGWMLKARSQKKKVALELGGDAACIVDEGADVSAVVQRLMFGAFYQSGQSCISLQRLFLHDSLYQEVARELVAETERLVAGDPLDESTFIGPMISEEEAQRVERWVDEAVAGGARCLIGGKRSGAFYPPTVLEAVPPSATLACEEVFGPVVTLTRFTDFGRVCDAVNTSKYGLQVGVFTKQLAKAFYAFENIEAGSVVINDVPSVRVDSQPYGGIKDSGLGREGIVPAIEEMTELKTLLLKNVARLS